MNLLLFNIQKRTRRGDKETSKGNNELFESVYEPGDATGQI